MPALDVGSEAIDRSSYSLLNYTYIVEENPCNIDGIVTLVEVWVYEAMENVSVALFEQVAPDTFTSRSQEFLGNIPVGYSSHVVSLTAKAGEYIGIYSTLGKIEKQNVGVGYWSRDSNKIPCTDWLFAYSTPRSISLYGTGVPLGPDYTHCIVEDYQYVMNCEGFIITLQTNVPCHMWLNPLINPVWNHPRSHLNRGLLTSYDSYRCINILKDIEQEEAGDTTEHTFIWTGWIWCQHEQFVFTSENNGCPIVTVSPPYKLHYSYAPPLDPCLFCHPGGDATDFVNLKTDSGITYMFSPVQDFVLWDITWQIAKEDAGVSPSHIAYRLFLSAPNGYPITPMVRTDLASSPPPDFPTFHTITFKIYPRKLYKGYWYTHGLYVPGALDPGQSTYFHHKEHDDYSCLPANKSWLKPPGGYPYQYFSTLSAGATCWGYTPYGPYWQRS